MSRWYVIFLSALTVLAVIGIAGAGIYLHKQYPNLLLWSIVASLGVAIGSIKSLLEVAKLAGELQSAQLQMKKLALEIEELQDKKADRSAVIVKPTEDDVKKYDTARVGLETLLKAIRPLIQQLRMIIKWPF